MTTTPRPLHVIMEDVAEVADTLRILQDMGTDELARCSFNDPASARTTVERVFFLFNQIPGMVNKLAGLQAEALSGQGCTA